LPFLALLTLIVAKVGEGWNPARTRPLAPSKW